MPDVREWLKGYPECPGVVSRSSQMAGRGENPYKYPGVVGWPSQMSGSGRESLPDVREL